MRGLRFIGFLGWNLACATPTSPAAPTTEPPAIVPPPKSVSEPPAIPAPPSYSEPSASPEPSAVSRPPDPAPTHVLKLHEPVKLGGGYTLQLEEVLIEAIVASPDGVYPGGGAVRVDLLLKRDLHQRRVSLVDITEGYDPKLAGWLDDFRVTLVEVHDMHTQPRVALAIEAVGHTLSAELPKHHRVARGESFTLEDGDRIEFTGHSHKRTHEGQRSPLIVHLDWHTPGQEPVTDYASLYPSDGDRTWRWRDLEFTLLDWSYGDWIEVDVRRLKRRRVSSSKH